MNEMQFRKLIENTFRAARTIKLSNENCTIESEISIANHLMKYDDVYAYFREMIKNGEYEKYFKD